MLYAICTLFLLASAWLAFCLWASIYFPEFFRKHPSLRPRWGPRGSPGVPIPNFGIAAVALCCGIWGSIPFWIDHFDDGPGSAVPLSLFGSLITVFIAVMFDSRRRY